MINITPELGKGCFIVSYFDGDEYVDCGQFQQSGDAGAFAAKLIGTTPLENVRLVFNIDLLDEVNSHV